MTTQGQILEIFRIALDNKPIFLPRVSQTLKFEGTAPKTTLSFDNLLGLMELIESTLIVIFYYMGRMHLNISQKKRCTWAESRVFQSAEPPLFSGWITLAALMRDRVASLFSFYWGLLT